jgi:hypothetical protein
LGILLFGGCNGSVRDHDGFLKKLILKFLKELWQPVWRFLVCPVWKFVFPVKDLRTGIEQSRMRYYLVQFSYRSGEKYGA